MEPEPIITTTPTSDCCQVTIPTRFNKYSRGAHSSRDSDEDALPKRITDRLQRCAERRQQIAKKTEATQNKRVYKRVRHQAKHRRLYIIQWQKVRKEMQIQEDR